MDMAIDQHQRQVLRKQLSISAAVSKPTLCSLRSQQTTCTSTGTNNFTMINTSLSLQFIAVFKAFYYPAAWRQVTFIKQLMSSNSVHDCASGSYGKCHKSNEINCYYKT